MENKKWCQKCKYWNEKYMKCDNKEQDGSEVGYFMCPPDNVCELYESAT